MGATFITSQSRGSHICFKFRAAEFTWRHAVDWIMITRLLQVVPELPKPIIVSMFYGKLFVNSMFLPMLRTSIGIDAHDYLLSQAYPRLKGQWSRHLRDYLKDDRKEIKMKSIQRAREWTRGDRVPQYIPTDSLPIV